MKFSMSKKHLVNALNRMREISTKGIKTEFELACRVTIDVAKDVVHFYATNGHLSGHWEVTNTTDLNLKCEEEGPVTVDTGVVLGVVSSIGGQDAVIEAKLDGETLLCRDMGAKGKKQAKLQTLSKSHKFNIKKPASGFSFTVSKDTFRNGILRVSQFASRMNYKIRYQMVCLHFLKNETRFVCGDGMRFVVMCEKLTTPNSQVTDDDGIRFLMPVDQAAIIGNVLDGAENVDFIYENEQTCYIKPQNAMELLLVGIPNEKYIPYEKHAFNIDKAKIVVDANAKDYAEAVSIVCSVRDKEKEAQGLFHHAKFNVENGAINMLVDENKYQCDVDCEASIYPLDGVAKYNSIYAATYLQDVVSVCKKPMVRFYCVDEKRSIIVEPIETDDNNKVAGIPQDKKTDASRTLMFFTAVVDDEG